MKPSISSPHSPGVMMSDETLKEWSQIPARNICELIELCLKSTYFRFQDAFYEQVDGAAMASPLSPIVANIYVYGGFWEESSGISTTTSQNMAIVDDTLCSGHMITNCRDSTTISTVNILPYNTIGGRRKDSLHWCCFDKERNPIILWDPS